MNDKELLEMLYRLGRNRKSSLAASDVDVTKEREDQLCAATIKKIILSANTNNGTNKSLAASATSPSVNRMKVLYDFVI